MDCCIFWCTSGVETHSLAFTHLPLCTNREFVPSARNIACIDRDEGGWMGRVERGPQGVQICAQNVTGKKGNCQEEIEKGLDIDIQLQQESNRYNPIVLDSCRGQNHSARHNFVHDYSLRQNNEGGLGTSPKTRLLVCFRPTHKVFSERPPLPPLQLSMTVQRPT